MAKKIFFLVITCCWLAAQARATVSPDWEKHTIGEQVSPIYVYVKDMDGDGDLDVASTTNRHPQTWDSEVAWFQNNLNQGAPWEKFIISSSAPEDDPLTNTNGIIIADIDKDGHEDVAVGTGKVTENIGSIYWFKAPADPDGAWQRFAVEVEAANSFFKIYTMDVNEDQMEDIVAGGRQRAHIFLNPGDPAQAGAQWTKVDMPEETGSSLYLDDINGDGKTDIINSFLHGNVSWIDLDFSDGEILFDRTMIDADLERAFDVNTLDVNSDMKKDVLVSMLNLPGLYWYQAPANPDDPWIQHSISDTFNGTDIYSGDINRDSNMDLIVSGAYIDTISWFEYRLQGGQALWTEHVIDDAVDDPGDVSLNDLDGDGDLDIVVAGLREDQMVWYENKIPGSNVCLLEYLLGEDAPRLATFRKVRDNHLVALPGGKWLVKAYYAVSGPIVQSLRDLNSLLNVFRCKTY